jgi:hypothetical protein
MFVASFPFRVFIYGGFRFHRTRERSTLRFSGGAQRTVRCNRLLN